MSPAFEERRHLALVRAELDRTNTDGDADPENIVRGVE